MSINVLAAEQIEPGSKGEAERLPVLTAGLLIFGLSLLCWLPLLLPIIALVHR
ncbi:MAG TPA: hypothetical protein VL985_20245 [Stellaceae bacterium]|nr:hypothetical protein [Stellaceae bacterium]